MNLDERTPNEQQRTEELSDAQATDPVEGSDTDAVQELASMEEGLATVPIDASGTVIEEPEERTVVLRVSTQREGIIEVSPGYQFRDPQITVQLEGVTVTSDGLTHRLAEKLKIYLPSWTRSNLIRGYYKPEDPYWN